MMKMRACAASAALVALMSSGCGSTALRGVQANGTNGLTANGAGSSNADNAGLDAGGGNPLQGGSSGGSTGGSGLSGASGSTGTGLSGATGSTGGGAASVTGGTTGGSVVGGSTKPIRVGIVVTDVAAIAAAFGKPGADVTASPKAVVDYMNKHGGIAGRQIAATFYKEDSAGDQNTEGQKACQALTQDSKMDIVVSLGDLGGDVLPSCLRQQGVALINAVSWAADHVAIQHNPNELLPNAIPLDTSVGALIRQASARGFLKSGDKLGLLVENCPWGPRIVSNTVMPVAKQLGVSIDQASYQCITNIVSDLGPVSQAMQSASTKFKIDNVTHVMAISSAEAFVMTQFSNDAQQQKYSPKYIVSSQAYPYQDTAPDAIVKYSSDAPANMLGLGYIPLLDVGPAARPATAGQKNAQATCAKADPQMGQVGRNNDGNKPGKYFDEAVFFSQCDTLYVTKALLEANGVRFRISDVTAGFRAVLARGMPSSLLSGGSFEPVGGSSQVGADTLRPFAYDASRQQWQYIGPAFHAN
jgi:hypothetical protein